MIYAFSAMIAATALSGYLAYNRHKKVTEVRQALKVWQTKAEHATEQVDKLRHVISRMQEIQGNAKERKQKIRKGDSQQQFDATLDLLGGEK